MNLFNNSGTDLEETAEETNVDDPTQETAQVDDVEELDTDVEDTDESNEETDDSDEEETEGDIFVVEGHEFTKEQLENAVDVEEMKKSLQADYTKKTMLLADERKATESERDSLSNLAAELQVLVEEDKGINWQELREDDPDEYIRKKELADNRIKKLEDAKTKLKPSNKLSNEEVAQEQIKLVESFPEWVKKDDKGNVTEVTQEYQKDMKAMAEHAKELGFTDEQITGFDSASIVKAVINSMKFSEKKGKIEIAKKKVKAKQNKPAKTKQPQQPTSLFNKSA